MALLSPPPRLRPAILATTAVGNVGSLPLAMVLSLVRSPHLALGAHGADAADMAVCFIMLGWFYATLVQMPMGARALCFALCCALAVPAVLTERRLREGACARLPA